MRREHDQAVRRIGGASRLTRSVGSAAPLLIAGLLALPVGAGENAAGTTLAGFAQPMRTVTLAPLRPGRIRQIAVDEGQFIEAGRVAVYLDDHVQQRRVEIAKALAESRLELQLARVRMEQARRELERIEGLARGRNVSTKELNDAQANAEAARLAYQQAIFKHEQARREYRLQQALLDDLHLKAPFDAYVARRHKDAGDSIQEQEPILTLVQLDPLVVTVDCPLEAGCELRVGQKVLVRPLGVDLPPREGEVYFISRVADPASQTVRVKLRVANDDAGWTAGLRVELRFPTATAAAGAARPHGK